MKQLVKLVSIFWLSMALLACSSMKYSALEKIGIHKRDVLVDRIEQTQESQQESKQIIVSAYEQFKQLVEVDGGELEARYTSLNSVVQDSIKASDEVLERIEAVENVAEALFNEWEDELGDYSNQNLRKLSQQKLRVSRREYASLNKQMYRAYDNIQPVLTVLKDQNLYLKHNLNARAVDALHGEILNIQSDVDRLIQEMDVAIAEADAFISKMQAN